MGWYEKVLVTEDQHVKTELQCCCCEYCWGACINTENALKCFEVIGGVLTEVACPACGDPCFYNSTSFPGVAYVCLATKTKEQCESILDVNGNPCIWLGCGSLQKECYYSVCQGLWFPKHGTAKGGAYSLCATPVANNTESGLYSPLCEP